jgi:hypothetical protein
MLVENMPRAIVAHKEAAVCERQRNSDYYYEYLHSMQKNNCTDTGRHRHRHRHRHVNHTDWTYCILLLLSTQRSKYALS